MKYRDHRSGKIDFGPAIITATSLLTLFNIMTEVSKIMTIALKS